MRKWPYIIELSSLSDSKPFCEEYKQRGFEYRRHYRPSRLVEFWLDEREVGILEKDERVAGLSKPPYLEDVHPQANSYNFGQIPHTMSGPFIKGFVDPTDRDWGKAFGAEDPSKLSGWRFSTRKEFSLDILGDGTDVDVVIADELMGYDCAEWISNKTGVSRFVRYQWYDEWNFYTNGVPRPSVGSNVYPTNSLIALYHGNHVGGTAAGRFYGWAPEANIYSLPLLTSTPHPSYNPIFAFVVLLSFLLNKPKNPRTGFKNPTIVNNSWLFGYIPFPVWSQQDASIELSSLQIGSNIYNASNPNPSGWTDTGIKTDSNIDYLLHNGAFTGDAWPAFESTTDSLMADCIAAGAIFVACAGNRCTWVDRNQTDDNYILATHAATGQIFSPVVHAATPGLFHDAISGTYNPGARAGNTAINVGAISPTVPDRYSRSTFSSFGPGVDIYAPGALIPSTSCNDGSSTLDGKYGGDNYYKLSGGTSMASPQVAGVLAAIASGVNQGRFTNKDAKEILNILAIQDRLSYGQTPSGYYTSNWYVNAFNPPTGLIFIEDSSFNVPQLPLQINPGVFLSFFFDIQDRYLFYLITGIGPNDTYFEMLDSNGVTVQNPSIAMFDYQELTFEYTLDTNHPIDIRTNPLDPNTSVPSSWVEIVVGSGSLGDAYTAITFKPPAGTSGTYYYVSTSNPGVMQGAITVTPDPTAPEPFYLKTTQSIGTGDQLTGVVGQGTLAKVGGIIEWTAPYSYPVNTSIYLQSSTNINKYIEIEIVPWPGNLGKLNTFADPNHIARGENSSLYLNDKLRKVNGHISTQKGKTVAEVYDGQKIVNGYNVSYPRPNRLYR